MCVGCVGGSMCMGVWCVRGVGGSMCMGIWCVRGVVMWGCGW